MYAHAPQLDNIPRPNNNSNRDGPWGATLRLQGGSVVHPVRSESSPQRFSPLTGGPPPHRHAATGRAPHSGVNAKLCLLAGSINPIPIAPVACCTIRKLTVSNVVMMDAQLFFCGWWAPEALSTPSTGSGNASPPPDRASSRHTAMPQTDTPSGSKMLPRVSALVHVGPRLPDCIAHRAATNVTYQRTCARAWVGGAKMATGLDPATGPPRSRNLL